MALHYDQLPARMRAQVDAVLEAKGSSPASRKPSRREARTPGLPVVCKRCSATFSTYGKSEDHYHEGVSRVECVL